MSNLTDALIAAKLVGGSGGSGGLPEVTADDNGDVLTVVEGAWGKATPSGGGTLSSYSMNLSLNNENNETIPAGGIKFWTFSGNLRSNIPTNAIPISVSLSNGSFDDQNYIATGWNVYVNDGQVSGNVWIRNFSSSQAFNANSSSIKIKFLALS